MTKSGARLPAALSLIFAFLALVALLAGAPNRGLPRQQVPEVRNTGAALDTAPTLRLGEERRIVLGEGSEHPDPISTLEVNGEGLVFLLDARIEWVSGGKSLRVLTLAGLGSGSLTRA